MRMGVSSRLTIKLAPVTSITPAEDSQSLLISTLDSTVRLMDRANGTMLNTFSGHVNKDYSSRACFGYGESTVICGDEEGRLWAWDLVNVSLLPTKSRIESYLGYRGRSSERTPQPRSMTD